MNRPLVPEDVPGGVRRARPSIYLYRSAAAYVRAHVMNSTPEAAARSLYGNDVVTAEILKAATTQATTTSTGWAGALAQQAIEDLLLETTVASAASALIQKGLRVSFDGRASIRIPGRTLSPQDAGGWTGEGQPIRVRNLHATAGPILTPRKLAAICVYSREQASSSNIEAFVRADMSDAVRLSLDTTLFGTQADDGTTPGGILNSVSGLTPTAGGGMNALEADLKNLTAALVTAGAGANPALITNPIQAMSLKLVGGPKFDLPVLMSNSIAAGTVIMVEPSSFVSAFDPLPEFSVTDQDLIHMEDTNPADIVAGGGAAVPVKALYQVDCLALKMRLRASWGMRAPHVAYLTGATW